MEMPRWCDFEKLAEIAVHQTSPKSGSIHGVAHWKQVEWNGIHLSSRTDADILVVRLFAWFHDSRRRNDSFDPGHGRRGAAYAKTLRKQVFDLEDAAFEKLIIACTLHTDEFQNDDPTIGTCWDADRLDLGRVGIRPSALFMSTAFGKELAQAGTFSRFW